MHRVSNLRYGTITERFGYVVLVQIAAYPDHSIFVLQSTFYDAMYVLILPIYVQTRSKYFSIDI